MKNLAGISFICSINLVLSFGAHVVPNSCEEECTQSKKDSFNGPKILHDVHCHRGCRLYRIMYMLSNPFLDHKGFINECTQSCQDGYLEAESKKSCIIGCTIQEKRYARIGELHGQLSVIRKQPLLEHIQHMQRYLTLFGVPSLDHSVKRLCSWTLISSRNFSKILIVRSEQVPAPGHMVIAEAPAQREELQLGGARPGLMRDGTTEKRKNDFWWLCVIERTLQPLMAGLLLLSILSFIWLCLSSSKDATPTNAKELIVPNEVGNIKFQVHSPQALQEGDEKKVPLMKIPLDEV